MKAHKFIVTVLVGASLMLAGCKETPYLPSPGDNGNNQPDKFTGVLPDPEGVEIPEGTITVGKAMEIGKALASGDVTPEEYYIKGWITRLGDKNADGIANYGNATFYIAENNTGFNEFYAYQVYGKDGKKLVDISQVAVGDFVVIKGKITNYNGTVETQSQGKAHICISTNENFNPKDPEPTPAPEGVEIPEGTLNVYQAIELGSTLADGAVTPDKYYVMGYVTHLDAKHESGMSGYGNGTFYIAANKDGFHTKEFEAYQVYGKNGAKFTNMDAVAVGDFVIIYGQLTKYKETIETTGKGAAYVYYSTNPNW